MIGTDHGSCENVHLEEGVKLQKIRIEHDEFAVHKLWFGLSDGTIKTVGGPKQMSSAIRLDIKSKTIKFGDDGEEIIGLYGRLQGDKPL